MNKSSRITVVTLGYLINKKTNKVLLGRKKYGKTKGILIGFGGKIEENDTSIKDGFIREFKEETSLTAIEPEFKAAIFFHTTEKLIPCYVYTITKWQGIPKDTSEMSVEWHKINRIPFEQMWEDNKLWLPFILSGQEGLLIHVHRFNERTLKANKVAIKFNQQLHERLHLKP
jgi:ADP-ribose pyrophosphatase YjhB (NUDIX family)